jgi:DNA polymerase-3 subunit delta'
MNGTAIPRHHQIAERMARVGRKRGILSHSLLIHGPIGAGHREIASRFGQSVFCETGEGPFGACGKCRNCRRIWQGIHPDWIWLEPNREAKGLPNISIDSLRSLQDRLVLEPYEGPKVVGCIFEAEKMRPEAANSLLKLVEEPPEHAQFILVTENRQKILPTIRSRCIPIPLAPPSPETLAEELVETGNWQAGEAIQAALWSLNEGLDPEGAISEALTDFREEGRHLLDLAIHQGEHAFFAVLKDLKQDRETMARYLFLWRDFLRETLLVRGGRGEPFTYKSYMSDFQKWSNRLKPSDISDLMDLAMDCEEALSGYANPVHTLGSFLSTVSACAGTPSSA